MQIRVVPDGRSICSRIRPAKSFHSHMSSSLSQIDDDTGAMRRACLALTFAAACLAVPAIADEPSFYTGISNGVAVLGNAGGQSLNSVPGARLLNRDTDRLTATTLYGGYRFSHGFALEAARTSFGSGVNTDDPVLYATPAEQMSAWSLAGVGSFELSDSLTLFAKLGINFAPNAAYSSFAVDTPSRPGRVYGFGVSYQVSGRLELRAQSERYTGLGQTENGELEANAVTFGVRLRF
jgi:opacity protein-like surface antigen